MCLSMLLGRAGCRGEVCSECIDSFIQEMWREGIRAVRRTVPNRMHTHAHTSTTAMQVISFDQSSVRESKESRERRGRVRERGTGVRE